MTDRTPAEPHLYGVFDKLTPEQLRAAADACLRDDSLSQENRTLLYLALSTAAEYQLDAQAFRKYRWSEKAEEAMLARRFIGAPNIRVEDRQKLGWAVILGSSAESMNYVFDGTALDARGR